MATILTMYTMKTKSIIGMNTYMTSLILNITEGEKSNRHTPKVVCVLYYENKGLDDINLSKIFNSSVKNCG